MAQADDEVNGKNQPTKLPTTSEHQLRVVMCVLRALMCFWHSSLTYIIVIALLVMGVHRGW